MGLKEVRRSVREAWRRVRWSLRRAVAPPILPANPDGSVRIHIGCGKIDAPGYVNIDVRPLPHVHYVQASVPLEMFADNHADLIYASHVLEHFSAKGAAVALKEWHRVLKPGGVLRLAVPDFAVLVEIYRDSGEIESIFGPLMGGQSYEANFHQSIYDEPGLRRLLLKTGFREVRRWDPAAGEHHDFKDTSSRILTAGGKEYAISLNIEAIK